MSSNANINDPRLGNTLDGTEGRLGDRRTDPSARATKDSTEPGTSNPASLSGNPNTKVQRNKPHVKPPLIDVPMQKFIVYLIAALAALTAFYAWRFTVWADEVGGYWNLMTGSRNVERADPSDLGDLAREHRAKAGEKGKPTSKDDVEDLIWRLASALGVKPAELSAAIRPLIDPTAQAPNSAVGGSAPGGGVAEAAAASAAAEQQEPGVLNVIGEALLD